MVVYIVIQIISKQCESNIKCWCFVSNMYLFAVDWKVWLSIHFRCSNLSYMFVSGIDIKIEDDNGQQVLDLLCKHPSQRSQEITALIYGRFCFVRLSWTKNQPRTVHVRMNILCLVSHFNILHSDFQYEFILKGNWGQIFFLPKNV